MGSSTKLPSGSPWGAATPNVPQQTVLKPKDVTGAALTAEETSMSEYADEWNQVHQAVNSSIPWASLMAQSVHATHMPDGRALPHFHPDVMAMQKMSA